MKIQLEKVLPKEIEKRSFEIITEELGGKQLDPELAPVIKRVIHTTADLDYADTLYFSQDAVKAGKETVLAGASIVTDTRMAEAGINIVAMSLADTQQFGILRLIVRDWQKARDVLERNGCVVNITEVLAIDVPDKPGGLAHVLDLLEPTGLSIEYMYAFTCGRRSPGEKAALIFRFEDPDKAIKVLQQHGINVLSSVELFERVEA
jgi:hypothetical protein